MSPEEHLKRLITRHQQRLQLLEEQKAIKGINADPAISIEIEDLKTKLEALQADLKREAQPEALSEYSVTQLTPIRRRQLEQEKQSLETNLELLNKKINLLRRNLTLETRPEEQLRLEVIIEDSEKTRTEFEDRLNGIMSLLE